MAFTPTQTEHVRFERDVLSAEWREPEPGLLEFWITADRFMRHMNRVLVGTMADVAHGLGTPDDFARCSPGGPAREAGATAPPHGLASRASPTMGIEMRVLLTNDDGIEAEGLQALRRALRELPGVELAVIAPDGNRSATARSITTRRPLWVEEVDFGDGTSATRPTARRSTACASPSSG